MCRRLAVRDHRCPSTGGFTSELRLGPALQPAEEDSAAFPSGAVRGDRSCPLPCHSGVWEIKERKKRTFPITQWHPVAFTQPQPCPGGGAVRGPLASGFAPTELNSECFYYDEFHTERDTAVNPARTSQLRAIVSVLPPPPSRPLTV